MSVIKVHMQAATPLVTIARSCKFNGVGRLIRLEMVISIAVVASQWLLRDMM